MIGAEPHRRPSFPRVGLMARLFALKAGSRGSKPAPANGSGKGGRTREPTSTPRKRSLRYAVAAAFLLATALSAATAPCGAVIAVTPTRIPLSLAPGETASGEVELINQGDEETSLRPWVSAVTTDASGATVFSRDDSCSWLAPGKDEVVLAPGTRGTCPFTVNVPEDAAPGAYRLALTFAPARDGDAGVGFTGGVAVLVELDILSTQEGRGGGSATAGTLAAVVAALLAAAVAALLLARARRERASGKGAGGGEA